MSIQITAAVSAAHKEHCIDASEQHRIDIDAEALQAYVNIYGIGDKDIDASTVSDAYDAYMGYWEDLSDFGWQQADEVLSCISCKDLAGLIRGYFDIKSYIKDLFTQEYSEYQGHIFRERI
jgi:hypothetical protein